MAGARKPMNLNLALGGKHWTKEEIKERTEREVQPITDGIAAPSYLTAKQKKQFNIIADQLKRIGIMGETDNDTLARYVTAQELYEQAVKDLQKLQKACPKNTDPLELVTWAGLLERLDKRVERYFKQATAAAAKLGLTISDRCRLAVPKAAEAPKVNKFSCFDGGKAAGNE
jgi:P27 family predicted phage terminase small subunit